MKSIAIAGIISAFIVIASPMVAAADSASNSAVTCINDADCHSKWLRAEQWVRTHSHWPVKTVTETLIETERQHFRNYSRLYYRITRETRDEQTVIRFEAGCLPSVHCAPDPAKAREAFSRFVRADQ